MSQPKTGCQTIGCSVTSCRYNGNGSFCELTRIQVEPMRECEGCHSGDPADESLCSSYKAK